MTNVSALPKSGIVNDADLARTTAVGDRARKPRFRDVGGIRLADNLDSLSRDEIDSHTTAQSASHPDSRAPVHQRVAALPRARGR